MGYVTAWKGEMRIIGILEIFAKGIFGIKVYIVSGT